MIIGFLYQIYSQREGYLIAQEKHKKFKLAVFGRFNYYGFRTRWFRTCD